MQFCGVRTNTWINIIYTRMKQWLCFVGKKGKTIQEECLWWCRNDYYLCYSEALSLFMHMCVPFCLPACLYANIAYIACPNVHVAWNNRVNTAQAWGWAACCCALLPTICLCQKYLLCAEWGMKSIQVLFFPVAPSWRQRKLYWSLPEQPTL